MGDPLDIIKDVGLNFVTGGLYSVGKAAKKTVETGSPMPLLTQGLDVGVAAVGVDLATEIGGPKAAMAYNLAGLTAGLAGGAGMFSSLPGFAPNGGVAPLVTAPAGPIPLASGVEMGVPGTANYVAPGMSEVGLQAAATPMSSTAPGGLANLAGLPGGTVAGPAAISTAAPNAASNTVPSLASSVPPSTKTVEEAAKSFWDSPAGQSVMVTGGFAGAQMITGAMQGMFQGMSAQKKLELEQLINKQYQAQIQYKNKNNAYAPLLTFKPTA
jgi:hypothetical protein